MEFFIRGCRWVVHATSIIFLNSLCRVVCPFRISKSLSRAMDSNAIFEDVNLNYFFSFSLLRLFWFLSLFFCVILGLTDLIWQIIWRAFTSQTNVNRKEIFISVFNQLYAQNLFHIKFYFMPLHVSSTCAHHQEVKIALHSLWYHHIIMWWYQRLCNVSSTCARNMWRHEIKLIVKQILCINE